MVAAAVGSALESDWGARILVDGWCGIQGGLLGLLLAVLIRQRSDRVIRAWFLSLCVLGVGGYVAFRLTTSGADGENIGLGMVALVATMVGLSGIFGTVAVVVGGLRRGAESPADRPSDGS
ncbi:hypothetical protein [Nocardia macrotermitis]|uniref:Uncharacterized protein n=1 Tax=Nocardia macrotermitis TaxID=2585198 RepID=A0A7K0D1D3_9NOCA|nr:hypothetical protein [Nocardia macrotermitis]MQY19498.1 hypothetical protein [Nocardia macrotermitis]